MNRIYKNIFSLTLIQFFNYLSPLLVLPYLSRTLSIDGFGLLMLTISMISICLVITDFGFNISSTHWISINRDDKNKVANHIGAVLVIKLILIFFLIFILYYYIKYITELPIKDKNSYIILVSLIVIFQSFQPTWFFQGIERMFNITIFMATSKIFYIILVFLLVKDKNDITTTLICLLTSNIIASVLSLVSIYLNKYFIKLPPLSYTIQILKIGIPYFFSRASVSVYTSASTFIVGSLSGLHQSAIFSSAEKLYQAGQSITSPVSQAIFPYIAKTGEKNILYKFIAIISIPLLMLCIACLLLSKEIITIFYGDSFYEAYPVLNIFIICTLINFIGVNFGYPAFAVFNRLDIPNKTTIVGFFVQIFSLLYLFRTDNISAYTVACSVLLTETIVMIIRVCLYLMIVKKEKKQPNVKN
ncbi:oligosaccharide flippase family protein [Providencia sp. PROV150]|uniref:oligosaccharide flippase family protein n=1 Tax=Providencia sp. PROV150 TaxID=2949860 RepID=UPI0023496669|nr:oligosaccharide flippase family protein [Providencia sp. PROV150]